MKYSRWATLAEIKERTKKIKVNDNIKKSGLQIMHKDQTLHICDENMQTLVIGEAGSGKTQSIVLPTINLAARANESLIITDPLGELYKKTGNMLKKKGYEVRIINFENPKRSNTWNPLEIPYILYKNGEENKAIKMIDDIAYYLFNDKNDVQKDMYWQITASNLFTGLTLYLFEKAEKDEINILSIYNMAHTINKDILNNIEKTSSIYINLSGTLEAPPETKGSIISTFDQKIKSYIKSESISTLIGKNDIDLLKINKEKTALFLVSGITNISNNIIPLIVNQIFDLAEPNKNRINIILDEFDEIQPIKDISRILHYSRTKNINFTIIIKSFLNLINTYKEEAKIIKTSFNAIVYLLANDMETLKEISQLCGRKSENEYLITEEELKNMKQFEAIIMMHRIYPIRTKLLPNYKIDWNEEFEELDLPEEIKEGIKIYK